MDIKIAKELRGWQIRRCGLRSRESPCRLEEILMYLELEERTDRVREPPSNVPRMSFMIVLFQSEFLDCIPRWDLELLRF